MSTKRSKIDRIFTGLVLVSLTLFCSLVSAQTQTPSPAATKDQTSGGSDTETQKDFKYVLEIGGQYRDVNGERPSKFEEYKSVRNGFLFRRGSFEYNPEGSPTFLNFAARNVSERDQQYYIEGGQFGRFRLKGTWDSQPHLYARGVASLLGGAGPGIYTVADSVQADLQALDPPMAGTTVPNPALIAATKSYVNSATRFDLRSQRQTLSVDGRYNVTSNFYVGFRVFDTKRFGQRPLGTGTYERIGTSIGDTFRVHSVELPAEIDQRTTNFAFVAGYLTKDWGVNFEYTYSNFSNDINSYVYDNPFRLTDQATTGTGGAFNRMAFARGLHGAMPDNEAQGIMITGFVNLPLDSRWAGAFGWQRWSQNDPFVPYTLNTQTGAPLNVTDPANLPEDSLNGEIENITVDQLFTTRPWSNLTFNARYKAYREHNNTEPILFPGYAAFLEAWWRPSIQGSYSLPGQPKPIENEPASYTRQRAGGEVIWEIFSNLRWKGEFEWERWDRTHRQADQTNEQKYITSVMWKPFKKLKTDLDYRYQVRTPDAYIVGPLENQQLRMFDQAKRIRHDVKSNGSGQLRRRSASRAISCTSPTITTRTSTG
ncbi:MAG: MtrB/PioB family outer membrane beta-barrel protein [bacterium]|nr:MtrB/PioB family outer membrane beta-barrel protein [bacterium]